MMLKMDYGKTMTAVLAVVVAFAAHGIEVSHSSKDSLVGFVAKDLETCLKEASGKIVLREDPGLSIQQWRLKSEGGELVISGCDGMGIAFGVYTFLEKHAGCRWYAPDTEVIPDRRGWKIPQLDETGVPAIPDREMYVGHDFMDGVWRLRNKETRRAAYGVGVGTGSPGDCHTFAAYEKYLRAHGGKMGEKGGFCMTDAKNRHLVADRMKEYIREDRRQLKGRPSYVMPSIYDLSQDDGGGGFGCTCGDCRALHDASGGWSGLNVAFASAVAEEVGREFPAVKVRTFAYSFTERPPTNDGVAAENLMVRYCRSFLFQPLTGDTDNGAILRDWDRHVKLKQIWSYWRSYSGPLFPAVKPREDIGGEMKFCRDMHVYGYFCENESPLERSFAMMQHWLFLKLAEDPDRDVFGLSEEFLGAYYGKAAGPMSKYLAYLEKREKANYAALGRGYLYGIGSGDLAMYVQRAYLDREFFEKVNGWLDEAQILVAEGDVTTALHVAHERMVVDRTMFELLASLRRQGYEPDTASAAKRIAETAPVLLKEWKSLPAQHLSERLEKSRIGAALVAKLPAPLPKELVGRDYVEWQCNQLLGDSCELVADADSVTGFAAKYPKMSHKVPYVAGVYDGFTKQMDELKLPAEKIPQDGKYHLLRLGLVKFTCSTRLYFDWSWQTTVWLPQFGIGPEEREVWLSVKFSGPTYVKGSTDPDAVLVERAFFATPPKGTPVIKPGTRQIKTHLHDLDMLIEHGHIQGATCDETGFYLSHAGGIVKFNWHGIRVAELSAPTHLGDCHVFDGRLYAAFGLRKPQKGPDGKEMRGMIGVWNAADLTPIRQKLFEEPLDGCVVLDGVIYSGVDCWGYNKPNGNRTALIQRFDINLNSLGITEVNFGFNIFYGVQTMCTDGKYLYFCNYSAGKGEFNPNGHNTVRLSPDLKVLDTFHYGGSEGFDIVPESISGPRKYPLTFRTAALGGGMRAWRADPKGNPPQEMLLLGELRDLRF